MFVFRELCLLTGLVRFAYVEKFN